MQRAIELLQEIRQAQYWNDKALVSSLVETLQSLPGFPKGEPGDHWVIKRRKGA